MGWMNSWDVFQKMTLKVYLTYLVDKYKKDYSNMLISLEENMN